MQQVMKFAELTQEVQVARPQEVVFDIGLTPGRRRLKDMVGAGKQHLFSVLVYFLKIEVEISYGSIMATSRSEWSHEVMIIGTSFLHLRPSSSSV
jgi:hypothetical protein